MNKVKYEPWSPESFPDYTGKQSFLQQFRTAVEGMAGPKILKQRGEEDWMKKQKEKAKLHYTGEYPEDPNSVRDILKELYTKLEEVWGDAGYQYNMKIGIGERRPMRSMTYKSLFEFIKEFTKKYLSLANGIYNEIQRIIGDLNKMNGMGFLDFEEGWYLSDGSLDTFPGKQIEESMKSFEDSSKKLIYGPMENKMSITDMISDLNRNLDQKIKDEIVAREERNEMRQERAEYFENIRGQFIPEGTDPNDPIFEAYARFPKGTGPEVGESESDGGESGPGEEGHRDPIEEFKKLAKNHNLEVQSWPDHRGTELSEDIKRVLSEKIKKTYRGLSLELHPDKNPDDQIAANANFQKMKNLYDEIQRKYNLAGYLKKKKKEKKGKKSKKGSKKKMPIKTKKPKKPKKTKKAKKKS